MIRKLFQIFFILCSAISLFTNTSRASDEITSLSDVLPANTAGKYRQRWDQLDEKYQNEIRDNLAKHFNNVGILNSSLRPSVEERKFVLRIMRLVAYDEPEGLSDWSILNKWEKDVFTGYFENQVYFYSTLISKCDTSEKKDEEKKNSTPQLRKVILKHVDGCTTRGCARNCEIRKQQAIGNYSGVVYK